MPRMRKKTDLPTKACAACGRPFAWRRKWARNWDEVRFCSDRCRAEAKGGEPQGPKAARAAAVSTS
jgi:hypothetical protein